MKLLWGAILAVAFGAAGALVGGIWQGIAGIILGAVLGWLAVVDLETHRLPNRVQFPTFAALLGYILLASLFGQPRLGSALIGSAVVGVILVALALAAAGGLGMGDVKLGVIIGLWTGWLSPAGPLLALFAGFLLGGLSAIGLMIAGRANRNTRIAFGPYLIVGAAAASWLPAL